MKRLRDALASGLFSFAQVRTRRNAGRAREETTGIDDRRDVTYNTIEGVEGHLYGWREGPVRRVWSQRKDWGPGLPAGSSLS